MKKISYFIISLIFLMNTIACTGYKPIFSSSNYNFSISDHSISGNKKIGYQIYSKLYSIVKLNNRAVKDATTVGSFSGLGNLKFISNVHIIFKYL